jgi:type II secretory pathway component PulJ
MRRVFFRQKKSFMTLLETLIAVSLLSMLLVFVFGYFRQLAELSRMADQTQKESFQMRYLESRLAFVFERIVNESTSARKFYFYTQPAQAEFSTSPSLIFTFDNGVRGNPTFSGDVLGRLYVDLDHRLCFAIWPLFISEPHQYLQEEVLFTDVAKISYFFYAAPERVKDEKEITSGQTNDPEKKNPERDKWHEDEWAITFEQMPSIMKIIVHVAKNPEELKHGHSSRNIETKDLVFHFVLPSSKNPVYYPPN